MVSEVTLKNNQKVSLAFDFETVVKSILNNQEIKDAFLSALSLKTGVGESALKRIWDKKVSKIFEEFIKEFTIELIERNIEIRLKENPERFIKIFIRKELESHTASSRTGFSIATRYKSELHTLTTEDHPVFRRVPETHDNSDRSQKPNTYSYSTTFDEDIFKDYEKMETESEKIIKEIEKILNDKNCGPFTVSFEPIRMVNNKIKGTLSFEYTGSKENGERIKRHLSDFIVEKAIYTSSPLERPQFITIGNVADLKAVKETLKEMSPLEKAKEPKKKEHEQKAAPEAPKKDATAKKEPLGSLRKLFKKNTTHDKPEQSETKERADNSKAVPTYEFKKQLSIEENIASSLNLKDSNEVSKCISFIERHLSSDFPRHKLNSDKAKLNLVSSVCEAMKTFGMIGEDATFRDYFLPGNLVYLIKHACREGLIEGNENEAFLVKDDAYMNAFKLKIDQNFQSMNSNQKGRLF